MAKLIVFSNYIKNKTHSENLVQYISTREGVEYNGSDFKGEVTLSQKKVIDEVIEKFPNIKEIEEYKNFLEDKSKANASEFLTEAFGLMEDKTASKEIYLKYISERPRVEKLSTHGLFNSGGEADLKAEIEDIKNHKGVVWTHIISLKREDAERLDYDKLSSWQLLLKTKIPKIAEAMNIQMKNLVWNAAFHNEGHHPHVHLVMYSKDIKEGYLKEEGIKKIKSILMNEIYKEELLKIKEEKTLSRDEIKSEFEKEIDKSYQNIVTKNYNVDDKLVNAFFELSKDLPSRGKMAYAYQTKEVKNKVDKIVKLMVKNKDIKKLYESYIGYQKQLAEYYSGKEFKASTITSDKEFRKLQNMILGSAEKIKVGGYEFNNNEVKTSIEDKLKKLDVEMKNIETVHTFKSQEDDVKFTDSRKVKEKNIEEEYKEVVAAKEKSMKNIEDKFIKVLDKYSTESEELKNILMEIPRTDEFYDRLKITKELETAFNFIMNTPELKSDYENYTSACNDYKLFSKNFDMQNELKDFIAEIKSVSNCNKIFKEKEILGRKLESLKNIENKFNTAFHNCNRENDEFKSILKLMASKVVDPFVINYDNEKKIQYLVIDAADILFKSPELKEDFEKYIKVCEDYDDFTKKPVKTNVYDGLKDVLNEIMVAAVCDYRDLEKLKAIVKDDKVSDKILAGAEKLKQHYNLNKNLNVDYKDYPKQSRDEINYAVKDVVYDIADMLYFSAVENEIEKNKINMRNRKINRMKNKQANSLNY